MNREDIPNWVLYLDNESLEFIRNFITNSGSLKNMSKVYNVSYPTVRIMLDKLIQKIELNSKKEDVKFVNMIKSLAIDEQITLEVAKLIINRYKIERDEN